MLSQKVIGKRPRRKRATLKDQDIGCYICSEKFFSDQRIDFTTNNKQIHIGKCRNIYRAAIINYYNTFNFNIVMAAFNVSRKTAFRILIIAKKLSD